MKNVYTKIPNGKLTREYLDKVIGVFQPEGVEDYLPGTLPWCSWDRIGVDSHGLLCVSGDNYNSKLVKAKHHPIPEKDEHKVGDEVLLNPECNYVKRKVRKNPVGTVGVVSAIDSYGEYNVRWSNGDYNVGYFYEDLIPYVEELPKAPTKPSTRVLTENTTRILTGVEVVIPTVIRFTQRELSVITALTYFSTSKELYGIAEKIAPYVDEEECSKISDVIDFDISGNNTDGFDVSFKINNNLENK